MPKLLEKGKKLFLGVFMSYCLSLESFYLSLTSLGCSSGRTTVATAVGLRSLRPSAHQTNHSDPCIHSFMKSFLTSTQYFMTLVILRPNLLPDSSKFSLPYRFSFCPPPRPTEYIIMRCVFIAQGENNVLLNNNLALRRLYY